jgi:alpha-L-rhamnosidase
MARRYRAIVVPRVTRMPDSTRRWIEDYVTAGGTIVTDTGDIALSARIAAALPADVALEPPTPAIGFVHRKLRDADVYFLANTSNVARDVTARFSGNISGERWDPMTGAVEPLELSGGLASLRFAPYGSLVVVFRAASSAPPRATAMRPTTTRVLDQGWTVAVGEGTRTSVDLPHSWTSDPKTRFFSGSATYRATVRVALSNRVAGARVFLDFGAGTAVSRDALPGGTMRGSSFAALIAPPIREAATVFVNGRRAGTIWAPPYRIDVTNLLREGANELQIDVYNTAINQLAEGGRLPDVAAVTERYGQRFRLQDLDNLQPIPSGLLAVPRLVTER